MLNIKKAVDPLLLKFAKIESHLNCGQLKTLLVIFG